MRVTDRGVGDVTIHRCGSLVGEFERRGGELGKREVCVTLWGGTGVVIVNNTMIFI
jgi:hypothetical protein